jgi:hypothetical protein
MNDAAWAVVLWGFAVLLLGWTWVPALLSGLGGTRYTNGGSEDPTLLDGASEPEYAFWRDQLTARGYEPLGTGWMRLTLYGPAWRYETRMRVFRADGEQTFALVQKQPRPLGVWWLTTYATLWQDGGLLLTSNAVDQAPDDGEFVVQGMESTDLATVEELHLAQVRRARAAGRHPDQDGSLEALLRANARHTGPEARFTGVKLGQSYLVAHGGIHAALSVPPAILMGFGHWAVPLVNLVLGALLAAGEYNARRRAGRMMLAEIAAKMAESRQP